MLRCKTKVRTFCKELLFNIRKYILGKQIYKHGWCSNGLTSWTNAFLSYHEKNYLNNCAQGSEPVFYRLYVDDIFTLFKSNDHLKYLQDFLNSCHINMSFSMETKKENKLSFLDVEVIHRQGILQTIYNHNLLKIYF